MSRELLQEINDKFDECYVSPLDNAMQVIENLRSINDKLTTENKELRTAFQQLTAENIVLRTKNNNLIAKLEDGVRVTAKQHQDGWIGFMEWEDEPNNATLILDEGVKI